jgi:hypothetical protein
MAELAALLWADWGRRTSWVMQQAEPDEPDLTEAESMTRGAYRPKTGSDFMMVSGDSRTWERCPRSARMTVMP